MKVSTKYYFTDMNASFEGKFAACQVHVEQVVRRQSDPPGPSQ